MSEWDSDRERVAEIVRLIDSSSDAELVASLANEAQVDMLQIKWLHVVGPSAEFSAAYRSVNDALVRFDRRAQTAAIAATVEAVSRGGRAALERCTELVS